MRENLSLEIIGKRLKDIRKGMDLKQGTISQALDKKQSAISYVENGQSCSTSFLFQLLSYYSQYINIEDVFKKDFDFYHSRQRFMNKSFDEDIDNYTFSKNKQKIIILKEEIDTAFEKFEKE